MQLKDLDKKIPDAPGVYFFLGAPERTGGSSAPILYIGKATSLRSRVRSYFAKDLAEKRSQVIAKMVEEAREVRWQTADSVLEALILEANLIRKHLPPANSALKDQRSWNFVVITKEEFPQVLVTRERVLAFEEEKKYNAMFGPFPNGGELREAMKIVRRIFPYRDYKCTPKQGRPCFNRQIGMCPGVCTGEISREDYDQIIKNIKLFFSGKSKFLIKELKKQMHEAAEKHEFEKASAIKDQIAALGHVNDIALIKRDKIEQAGQATFRLEAYDISHISGTSIVGVMTVVEDGEAKKSDYRKFNIRGQRGADDPKALREVLRRRLRHNEWPYPDIIVVDGGQAQVNAAKLELLDTQFKIPIIGVVKDQRHKPKEILGPATIAQKHEKDILLANSESHRFAIAFFRQKSSKKSGIIHS